MTLTMCQTHEILSNQQKKIFNVSSVSAQAETINHD